MTDTWIRIEQKVYATTTASLKLPDGLAWDDIQDWRVEDDEFHYTTDGETWHEIYLHSDLDDFLWDERGHKAVIISDYLNEVLDSK